VVERRASVVGAVLVAVTTMLALGACGGSADGNGVVSGFSSSDDDGMEGAVLTTPYTLPEGTLVDTHGDDFDLRKGLEKPLTMVFFGYSKCPDICQAVMSDLASAMARLDESETDDVAVWFVTTDPARDDPATLRTYLDRFDPAFEGLTGPLEDIVDVAKAVHVFVKQGPELPSGGYEVNHGTPVLGVTPDGSVPIVWTAGTSAARLAEDIHTILTDGIPPLEEGDS
jgi:protein SCO1/2